MPSFTDSGGSKSPCFYQKKNQCNNGNSSQCHILPITKRPIEKVTTRSQAQYQLLIKTMGADALIETGKDKNNNSSNNQHYNGRQNSFLTNNKYITPPGVKSAAPITNLNNGTATRRESTLAKTIDLNNICLAPPGAKSAASIANLNNGTATRRESSLAKLTIAKKRDEHAHQLTLSTTSSTSTSSSINTNQNDTHNEVGFNPELVPHMGPILPYPPLFVLQTPSFLHYLTSWERKEILNYSQIYFIGKKGIKKRTPNTPTVYPGADGFDSKVVGFDDNNGSYIYVLYDHIGYRYEVQEIIGKGTFGVVLKAFDHKARKYVALKVIRNQTRFHTQAKEEIRILTKLLENDPDDKFNVVHMYEHFMFRNHPCIVFELLSLNLFELSRKNSFQGFTLSLIRRFTYAIVKCLYALSEFDIIHCDLKPENILLKQQNRSGIKVIDFGSSCFSNKRVHTYIQSRYYRSPEVILCGKYGPQIDMWSLGCILAELYQGRPLLDGENESDQLACMMELLDVPAPSFLNKCKASKVRQFFDSRGNPAYCARYHNGQYRPEQGRSPRLKKIRMTPASRVLMPMCRDAEFVDFIRQCLIWDPADRMTPAAALKHPWLSKRATYTTETAVYDDMT